MTTSLVWLRFRWTREVEPTQLVAAWHVIIRVAGQPLVVETIGARGAVTHRLALPYSKQDSATRQIRSSIPGVDVVEDDGPLAREPITLDLALALRIATRRRTLDVDDLAVTSRAVITALAEARGEERLVLQWILGRTVPARVVPTNTTRQSGFWVDRILEIAGLSVQPIDAESRRALSVKQSDPGWRVIGRIAVRAVDDHRRRHLLSQLLGALRTAEAPGVQIGTRRIDAAAISQPTMPWHWPLRLNVGEFAAVSGWPVGSTVEAPVATIASRRIPPNQLVPRQGKIVAEATFPGDERPLALSIPSATRHLHVLGPTGVGKSTALLNLITQDLAAHRSVAVIEPKGDLIEDVLTRIPEERLGDVVLLDPTDSIAPVGFNPLAPMGRPPELVADQLLGVLHRMYAAHWGPRTHDILGNALATLALIPGMTLCALPLLLTDSGFRRQIVGQLDDPIGLQPFWAGFDAWSEAERTAATAPVLNKLRPFLVNPRLRAVLGQSDPKLDIRSLFTERNILLVNLAKGLMGPEAANLLGSLVMAQLWQATLGRSALPANRRTAVFIYVDEFQDYLNLPVDLADALGQARGLGVGLTLAHQHLHQLDATMRSSVLANARSRVCFQLAAEDARLMSANTPLDPADFMGLGAYECYVQLVAGDFVQPWCSARTLPPPPITTDAGDVRTRSRSQFGVPIEIVDRSISDLMDRNKDQIGDLSPKRRRRGGS
jgi:hypothetical protein